MVLSSHLDSALHYGLPHSYFDWALLWELNMLPQHIGTEAPPIFSSWSWCGWDPCVEWRFSNTSGTLINLHEWMTDHTWIIWYKGQHHGYELVWKSPRIPQNPLRWDRYPKFASEEPYGRSPNTEIARQVATLEKSPSIAPREGCLHFWTYSAYFSLSTTIMSPEAFRIQLNPGLQQVSIHDSRDDFCGTIVLDELSISSNSPDPEETANFKDRVYEFIAISEAMTSSLTSLTVGHTISRRKESKPNGTCTMHYWCDGTMRRTFMRGLAWQRYLKRHFILDRLSRVLHGRR